MTADITDWSVRGRKRRFAEGVAHASKLADAVEQLLAGGRGPTEILQVLEEIEALNKLLIGLEHLLLDANSRRVLRATREALDGAIARTRQTLVKRHEEATR